ncbi:MAG: serpin family protein [Clostridia bacterium]
MQENKELKIKLKTAIILIVILLIAVVAIFALIMNKGDEIGSKGGSTIVGNESEKQQAMDTDFSMSFLKLENDKQNMIYSPLSIKYALKMLNEGANGNTKTQIENVIGELNLTKYNNIDKVLSLANGVYIRDTYAKYVKEDYKKILTEKYNAEINYDSFNNANNINNWIENKTLGIIKNMLKDDLVRDPLTEMLLINALAIDMEWEESFDSSKTYGEEFNLDNGNKMIATMMHKETKSDNISYYKNKDVTALTMDLKEYNDTQLEFIAIMPEENLSDYIESFTIDDFDTIIKKSKLASKTKHGVDISIPRFSFDYDLKLKNDLIKLGITDAFSDRVADFSNMSNRELYVSDALHKANIDFTEKGVKAAAVTVIVMADKSMVATPTKPEEIKIDKPFLYMIRDKNTGELWFVGTVYEPNSWEDDKADYQYR